MSETAQTLIKAALRSIGVIATGETPTSEELADGLEALKFMLRSWSAKNINIFALTRQAATLNGASSYTIGSGGTINTTRPVKILSAESADYPIEMIDFATYQRLNLSNSSGYCEKMWYNPLYPLGFIYPWPLSSEAITLNCLTPLTDPTAITTSITFPPEYDEAIKYNLAIRLAPEYQRNVSKEVVAIATESLKTLQSNNFGSQMTVVRPEIIKIAYPKYDIDYD